MPRIRTKWGWKCRYKGDRWTRSNHSNRPVDTRAEARKLAKVFGTYNNMQYVAIPLSEAELLP